MEIKDKRIDAGVLPRNMYKYGAEFVGTDISENQIIQAKELSAAQNMDITYEIASAENVDYPANTFDVITACQCFFYFNHEIVMPKLAMLLKPDGRLVILYMAWLPFEDEIAGNSEKLVLKYNPVWSGAGEAKHPISLPNCTDKYFDVVHSSEYDLEIPFTKETWNGRMKACRGIGASLSESEMNSWEKDHLDMLNRLAPDSFNVKHYAAMKILELVKPGYLCNN